VTGWVSAPGGQPGIFTIGVNREFCIKPNSARKVAELQTLKEYATGVLPPAEKKKQKSALSITQSISLQYAGLACRANVIALSF